MLKEDYQKKIAEIQNTLSIIFDTVISEKYDLLDKEWVLKMAYHNIIENDGDLEDISEAISELREEYDRWLPSLEDDLLFAFEYIEDIEEELEEEKPNLNILKNIFNKLIIEVEEVYLKAKEKNLDWVVRKIEKLDIL